MLDSNLTPLEIIVTLETTDLTPSAYKVDVNGVVKTFTLP